MRISAKVLIIGTVASTLLLTACGSDGPEVPAGSDAHVHIDPTDPDQLDADAAASTAMQVVLSWQPAVDESKSDALRRARPWLGGDLATTVDTSSTTPSGVQPDRQWLAWKESGDALTARCTRAESTPAAPEGMRTVVVDVRCGQTVLHTSGSATPLPAQTWRTTVTQTDAGWRVTSFRAR